MLVSWLLICFMGYGAPRVLSTMSVKRPTDLCGSAFRESPHVEEVKKGRAVEILREVEKRLIVKREAGVFLCTAERIEGRDDNIYIDRDLGAVGIPRAVLKRLEEGKQEKEMWGLFAHELCHIVPTLKDKENEIEVDACAILFLGGDRELRAGLEAIHEREDEISNRLLAAWLFILEKRGLIVKGVRK